MDYYDRIQKSIDFIEDHLTDDIPLEEVARVAYCSLFHFHRVFQAMVGDSVKEYIRRRRLSDAARELRYTKARVIDVAFKYRYENPESFSRAFKKMYAVAPQQHRKNKDPISFFNKVNLYDIESKLVKGGITVDYKIINKNDMKIVGRELRVRNDNGDNFRLIPQFWQKCMEEGVLQQLSSIPGVVKPGTTFGICTDYDGINTFTYIIGTEVNDFETIPKGMKARTIPASKYAVFTAKGPMPDAIQQTWKDIYSRWFPETGYERTDGPDFEYYDERSEVNDESCEVDIYIPVK